MYAVTEQNDCLVIATDETISRESTTSLLKEVQHQAAAFRKSKVLVDLSNAPISMKFMDHFQGAEEFVRYCSGLKVAFVFSSVEENYKFGETVASNRGGWLCLFDSTRDAIDWLLSAH